MRENVAEGPSFLDAPGSVALCFRRAYCCCAAETPTGMSHVAGLPQRRHENETPVDGRRDAICSRRPCVSRFDATSI